MANKEALKLLRLQNVDSFNKWVKLRRNRGKKALDLDDQDLSGLKLRWVDLKDAHLNGCNLRNTDLKGANLKRARLRQADLRGANLKEANLVRDFLLPDIAGTEVQTQGGTVGAGYHQENQRARLSQQ